MDWQEKSEEPVALKRAVIYRWSRSGYSPTLIPRPSATTLISSFSASDARISILAPFVESMSKSVLVTPAIACSNESMDSSYLQVSARRSTPRTVFPDQSFPVLLRLFS